MNEHLNRCKKSLEKFTIPDLKKTTSKFSVNYSICFLLLLEQNVTNFVA